MAFQSASAPITEPIGAFVLLYCGLVAQLSSAFCFQARASAFQLSRCTLCSEHLCKCLGPINLSYLENEAGGSQVQPRQFSGIVSQTSIPAGDNLASLLLHTNPYTLVKYF